MSEKAMLVKFLGELSAIYTDVAKQLDGLAGVVETGSMSPANGETVSVLIAKLGMARVQALKTGE